MTCKGLRAVPGTWEVFEHLGNQGSERLRRRDCSRFSEPGAEARSSDPRLMRILPRHVVSAKALDVCGVVVEAKSLRTPKAKGISQTQACSS